MSYAVRGLKKAPGFTVVALLTLTLGIGANTAIFSVVYRRLMRPLAYRDAERLVFLWSSRTTLPREPLSPARLIDFRQQLTSFDAVAGISQIPLNLTGSGEPERLDASSVSSNFFDILGVAPLLGDPFHAGTADDRAVVLSHGLWVRRFGADRAIVGRNITLNGSARMVVAVMPSNFEWPAITGDAEQPQRAATVDSRIDRRCADALRAIAPIRTFPPTGTRSTFGPSGGSKTASPSSRHSGRRT